MEKKIGENCMKSSFAFLLSQFFFKDVQLDRISWAERVMGRVQMIKAYTI
jgi:hypothetical protein